MNEFAANFILISLIMLVTGFVLGNHFKVVRREDPKEPEKEKDNVSLGN